MRPIYEIAKQISSDWKNVFYGAKPYLNAMFSLNTVNDMYGADNAKDIIRYFLSNASTWRGETAKQVKKELNSMVK